MSTSPKTVAKTASDGMPSYKFRWPLEHYILEKPIRRHSRAFQFPQMPRMRGKLYRLLSKDHPMKVLGKGKWKDKIKS